MIDAVLAFGALLVMFEFVVLSMVPPRYRLRLLGSKGGCIAVHLGMFALNLWVHWGTITGSMSATGAFVASLFTVEIAKIMYGTIVDDVRARRGLMRYSREELTL